jgi:hypothetical protein
MHHFSRWLYSRLQHYKLDLFAPTSCLLDVVLHFVARVVEYPTQAKTQDKFDQCKFLLYQMYSLRLVSQICVFLS